MNVALPAQNLSDLVRYANQQPKGVFYSVSALGTMPHLAGELFKIAAKINWNHVVYKGAGPAMIAVLGGEADLLFANPAVFMPHLTAGRLRALGTASLQRIGALPDMPTFHESGFPGFESLSWYGLAAPARTPAAIITRLNSEILSVIAGDEVRQWMLSQGFEPAGGSPAEAAQHIIREIAKWRTVVEASGAKPE